MSIQSKQIGWGTEESLLYDILKQIDRLVQVASGGGGVGTGTVTSVSVVTANGFGGSVSTPTTTPAITITTSITGILKGDGTAISAAIAGTDYLAPSGSGAALTGVYLLASGGTASGPNTFTGTTTNTFKYVFNSLGVTQTNGAGHWLANTTVAAAGAQQVSPSSVWEGQGWKTTATAGSQSVKFAIDVLPVQGTTNPTGNFRISTSINGAAYTFPLIIASGGGITSLADTTFAMGSRVSLTNTSSGQLTISTNSAGSSVNSNIVLSAGSLSETSGTKTAVSCTGSMNPSSGSLIMNGINLSYSVNLTGGANGLVTVINSTPTITAAVNVTGYDWNPVTPVNISGVHLAFRATSGNFLFGDTTKSANTGEKVLIISNASTNATGAQTNGIVIHAKDASTGVANSTLALYLEEAPEATATFTQTHRLKVWINNVEYYISLDTV